jgi:hypothetical protein
VSDFSQEKKKIVEGKLGGNEKKDAWGQRKCIRFLF